ncbi:capsular polysaccharide biosynthesis protein [Pseudomonas sp. JUb42]|uniref:glycosyltransferase family 61 protein n=1 Tax=Pseudomonas sp. JUb42 TaxID=2940611 RepID=UPI0021677782|nr:glycosyltransferase family 61 protein [Pseudomonas sp. JUb42]MCS3469750.1 capsular polysaccharide biosynthesis protein [Pseudomonas sp. JUb42]
MWFKQKERVYVFGASVGGINFYKRHGRQYEVLGFVDNSAQKHGQLVLNKLIHAPGELSQLSFDRIVIASDYYPEIFPQLIGLGIDEKKIDIHHPSMEANSLGQRLRHRAWILFQELICLRPGMLSDLLYQHYLKCRSSVKKPVKRFNLQWLDTTDEFKVYVFRRALPGSVQGPRYVGQNVAPVKVTLPEVALHRFRQGQVGSVSRSVLLPDQRVLQERVTTTTPGNADYSVGDMIFHGRRLALVAVGEPEPVDKGILINGISEGNYYHWVVEVLAQLQFVAELPAQYADYPILISGGSQKIPSIKAMIDGLGITRPFIYLQTHLNYRVDDLLWIDAPNNMIPNFKASHGYHTIDNFGRRDSIEYLRENALSLVAGLDMTDLPKRVFLARKGFLRRFNQQDVIELLEPYGFACVYMEDLDVHQQVAIMANAEVVVGPTGAAWTNIMFASAGTQALCWMAEEYGDLSCFSNLAAIVGVDLEFVRYRTGAHNSHELYYKEYVLDVSVVRAWLEQHVPGRDGLLLAKATNGV